MLPIADDWVQCGRPNAPFFRVGPGEESVHPLKCLTEGARDLCGALTGRTNRFATSHKSSMRTNDCCTAAFQENAHEVNVHQPQGRWIWVFKRRIRKMKHNCTHIYFYVGTKELYKQRRSYIVPPPSTEDKWAEDNYEKTSHTRASQVLFLNWLLVGFFFGETRHWKKNMINL